MTLSGQGRADLSLVFRVPSGPTILGFCYFIDRETEVQADEVVGPEAAQRVNKPG